MKNDHPIVISECPKCGTMKAARSRYLPPLKDEHGNPDLNRVYLMKIECLGCVEIGPAPVPDYMVSHPVTANPYVHFGSGLIKC